MKYDFKNKSNIMTLVAYGSTLLAFIFVFFNAFKNIFVKGNLGKILDLNHMSGTGLCGVCAILAMIFAFILVAFFIVEMLNVKPLACLKKWMFIPAILTVLFSVLSFIGMLVFLGNDIAKAAETSMTFTYVMFFIFTLCAGVAASLKYFLFDKTHKQTMHKTEQK